MSVSSDSAGKFSADKKLKKKRKRETEEVNAVADASERKKDKKKRKKDSDIAGEPAADDVSDAKPTKEKKIGRAHV